MNKQIQTFLEQGKDYLPYFKTIQESEVEPKRNCFFRACNLYCKKVLGFELNQQDFTDILDKTVPGTFIWEGLSLLVSLFNTKEYVIEVVVLNEEHKQRIENLLTLVSLTLSNKIELQVKDYFKQEPCIIFIHNLTTTWFPASHWDVVLNDSYKLLEIAYLAIYLTKP